MNEYIYSFNLVEKIENILQRPIIPFLKFLNPKSSEVSKHVSNNSVKNLIGMGGYLKSLFFCTV